MEAIVSDFDEYGKRYLPDFKLIIREFASGVVEMVQRPVNHMVEQRISEDQGFRGVAMREKTEEEKEAARDENLRRAERRARQKIRFLIYTIKADHLLTLTYRENMTDSEKLKADFTRFIRLVRVRYPDYLYVAVKEYQDRGALHMHVACVGRQDVKFLRKCWYAALGAPDATGSDSPGAVDVQYRQKRFSGASEVFNYVSLAGYLSKYISKTFDHDRELGARRYTASQKIPPPRVSRHFLGAYAVRDGEQAFAKALTSTLAHADFLGVKDYQLWNSLESGVLILRGHIDV